MKEYKTASDKAMDEQEEDDIVFIKVTRKTRETLKRYGFKGDTYDQIISRRFPDIQEKIVVERR